LYDLAPLRHVGSCDNGMDTCAAYQHQQGPIIQAFLDDKNYGVTHDWWFVSRHVW
jgi:hypothetical protein